jgi:hypothetical protein
MCANLLPLRVRIRGSMYSLRFCFFFFFRQISLSIIMVLYGRIVLRIHSHVLIIRVMSFALHWKFIYFDLLLLRVLALLDWICDIFEFNLGRHSRGPVKLLYSLVENLAVVAGGSESLVLIVAAL